MAGNLNDLINSLSESLSYGDVLAGEQLAKISSAIVKARIEKDMTQTEFAEYMGVSQGMVSKWESEDYNFTIEALASICEKLDWDMNVELKPRSKAGFSHKKVDTIGWKTNSVRNNNVIKLYGVA